MSIWAEFIIETTKFAMKPGYLYGVSEDGELYCVEATMPKPGETIMLPPLQMPPKEET